jgi:hypothetical protein
MEVTFEGEKKKKVDETIMKKMDEEIESQTKMRKSMICNFSFFSCLVKTEP